MLLHLSRAYLPARFDRTRSLVWHRSYINESLHLLHARCWSRHGSLQSRIRCSRVRHWATRYPEQLHLHHVANSDRTHPQDISWLLMDHTPLQATSHADLLSHLVCILCSLHHPGQLCSILHLGRLQLKDEAALNYLNHSLPSALVRTSLLHALARPIGFRNQQNPQKDSRGCVRRETPNYDSLRC